MASLAKLAGLRSAMQLARAAAMEPIEFWTKVQDILAERREQGRPPCPYEAERDWERYLHDLLGVPWPCEATAEFQALWPEVMGLLEAKGIKPGRGAFGGWGDGDRGISRAIWCLVRHLRPSKVVETGVARGITSRFILEALEVNATGHLWSIDLPPLLKSELHEQIAIAVPDRCRRRWSYVEGSSRRSLPTLLSELREIDIFVHDSRHSERNLRFELDRAWGSLRPGGFVVADDIDLNWGFHSFTTAFSGHPSLICPGEPLRPDPSRVDGTGLFAIARKDALGTGTRRA